jgi:DNA-binding transcriptional LysR family regulator
MRFDLTDLQLFIHVVEARSITAGAERSHIALASASARIRGMEDRLGIPLLLRGRRGVELTDSGRTLVHHARVVLQQMERMKGELGEYAQGLRGHVRLLCNTAAASEFLPEALAAFMAVHPNVDIDLEERPSRDIVAAVAAAQADVGIVTDGVDLANLQTFAFRPDRLVVVTASADPSKLGTPRQRHRSIDFAQILDFDFIGLTEDSALQQYLAAHAARLGKRLKLRIRMRSFEAVCRMVENGVGISVIPETAALRCQRSMAIKIVRLDDTWSERQLRICVRRFDDLSIYAKQVIESIQSH